MPNHLLADPLTGDPVYPEKYPERYVKVACAACTHCWIDLKQGRCFSGGPFDADLQATMAFCRRL